MFINCKTHKTKTHLALTIVQNPTIDKFQGGPVLAFRGPWLKICFKYLKKNHIQQARIQVLGLEGAKFGEGYWDRLGIQAGTERNPGGGPEGKPTISSFN